MQTKTHSITRSVNTVSPAIFLVSLFSLCVFVLFPATTNAYKFIEEKVFTVNDSLVLFTHTFSFSVLNKDAYVSYQAKSTNNNPKASGLDRAVYFTVLEDDKASPNLKSTAAFLFSTAPNTDQLYRVEAREPVEFTLAAFVNVPPSDVTIRDRNFSLELNRLPFTVFEEGSIRQFFFPLPPTTATDTSVSTATLVAPDILRYGTF